MIEPQFPSLGITKKEIYQNWEQAQLGQFRGLIVIGWLLGEGEFSWSYGKIIKHERTQDGMAVVRYATLVELELIDEALERGWLQIYVRGPTGMSVQKDSSYPHQVLHQATGKCLPRKVNLDR